MSIVTVTELLERELEEAVRDCKVRMIDQNFLESLVVDASFSKLYIQRSELSFSLMDMKCSYKMCMLYRLFLYC